MKKKIEETKRIINTAFMKFNKPALCWTGGKDSTVMLNIARKIEPNIPVIFIDTKRHFKETYEFKQLITDKWNLNLHVYKSDKNPDPKDRENCCNILKTIPLNRAAKDYDCLLIGIRHDEHPERSKEWVFSPRKDHWRAHPILNWTYGDIWEYIEHYQLPRHPLYSKGYKSIGCEPCTKPTEGDERSGRNQDKERIMKRLRDLGYF